MLRWGLIYATALLLYGAPALVAQNTTLSTGTNVPEDAASLVAHIIAFSGGGEEDGAGVFIGEDSLNVYFFTAAHVVERADSVQVEFKASPGEWVVATIDTVSSSREVDLAVIHVDRNRALALGFQPRYDRLGRSESVRDGDEVNPVGCPTGECWQAPLPADRVLTSNALEIAFQSVFVDGGSSGGAIFNRWWEVVGMVSNDVPPRAIALPVDFIVAQVNRWNIPVSLTRASIPRGGYEMSVGFAVLTPGSHPQVLRPDNESTIGVSKRFPGGRVTLTRRFQPLLSWHVGAMRLQPKNLTITGGTAGLGLDLLVGRLKLRPFAEVGIARMESRADVGGYFLGDPAVYTPVWRTTEKDGVGVGGGATLEFTVFPRVIVQMMGAGWNFSTPSDVSNAPTLPDLFFGAGLRFGL